MTKILETLIDDIASTLHATATQKTDARAAKKVISMVRSLDSEVVAESVLELARRDSRVRDYLPIWNDQVKDRGRLSDIIFFSAELADVANAPKQTELIIKHLDALRKAPHADEVTPHVRNFTEAPKVVRDKLVKVVRIALSLERALAEKKRVLESIALTWYSFVYLTNSQADVVEELVLSSIAEGDFDTALDAAKLHKKFNSLSGRTKRAKSLLNKLRGAADSVEYNPEMGIRGYSQKVREKALPQ